MQKSIYDSASGQRPFVPLIEQQSPQDDLKSVLQKQIKLLSKEEYYFFSYLLTLNGLYDDLAQLQQTLQKDRTFSLRKLFDYFDVNGDETIQFEDFYLSLQKLDIVLKKDELQRLFARLGGEDDSVISYSEFAQLFKFQSIPVWQQTKIPQDCVLNETQQSMVHRIFTIYAKMQKSLCMLQQQQTLKSLEELFLKLDQTRRGYLIYEDLIRYLKSLGVKVTDFKRVFFQIQRTKSGRVNFDEFIQEFASPQAFTEYKAIEVEKSRPKSEISKPRSEIQQQPLATLQAPEKKSSILDEYVHRSKVNETLDSIRLPGFTRYVFEN